MARFSWFPFAIVLDSLTLVSLTFHVGLEGGVLQVSLAGGRRCWVPLGPAHYVYSRDHHAHRKVWRRSGRTDVVAAGVLFHGGPSKAENISAVAHVALLSGSGTLELWRAFDGQWTAREQGSQHSMFSGAAVDTGISGYAVDTLRRLALPERPWRGTQFVPCWPGEQEGKREVKIGYALDEGFVKACGSEEAADAKIQEMHSWMNLIYEGQLWIHLTIGVVLKPERWDKTMSSATYPCNQTIEQRLDAFSAYGRKNLAERRMAAWSQLTDCFKPIPGRTTQVGLAFVRTLCSTYHGYSVVTDTKTTWQTLAHEIGHNFGAHHSFENGKGTTGGLMDYGDGKWQGEYQFHPYRQKELCGFLTSSMRSPQHFDVPNCWRTYDAESENYKGIWREGTEWSPCNIACSFDPARQRGVQTRLPVCVDRQENQLPDKYCFEKARPTDNIKKECEPAVKLCRAAARWELGEWSACISPYNLSCGGGRQKQAVQCLDGNRKIARGCPVNAQPVAPERACLIGNGACDMPAIWVNGDWLPEPSCSFGPTFQMRELRCVDVVTLASTSPRRCPVVRPLQEFRPLSVPRCTHSDTDCCMDARCHEISTEGKCKFQSRRLDAAMCVQNPAGIQELWRFLGGFFHRSEGCNFSQVPGPYMPILNGILGFPSSWPRIDAALAGPPGENEFVLFRGPQLLRYSVAAKSVLSGYPRAIVDEFEGVGEACPQCVDRVSAAIFDADALILRLWCGHGEVYCLVGHRWRSRASWRVFAGADVNKTAAINENVKWVLRPSRDFELDEVVAAAKNPHLSMFMTVLDSAGRACEVGSTSLGINTKCDTQPLPYFANSGHAHKCAGEVFCTDCTAGLCTSCDKGFSLSWGRCLPYKVRLRADFLDNSSQKEQERLARTGALDLTELETWVRSNMSAFVMGRAVRTHHPLRMRSVRGVAGGIVYFNRWSWTAWVWAAANTTGVLLLAPQKRITLRVLWDPCGPSVQVQDHDRDMMRELRCDAHIFGNVVERWVHVGVDFDGDLTLRVDGQKLVKEMQILGKVPIAFRDWTVGGANLSLSMVQLLDMDAWPPIRIQSLQSGWPFVAAAVVIILLGFFCTVQMCRVKPPEGMEYISDTLLFRVVEVYMVSCNALMVMCGIFVVAGMLLIVAFGPAKGRLNITDILYDGILQNQLPLLTRPILAGVAIVFVGSLGMRATRTRDCCWIVLYATIFIIMLSVEISELIQLNVLDFSPPSEDVNASSTTALTDNAWLRNHVNIVRTNYERFTGLMSRGHYDCNLEDTGVALCKANLAASQMIRCSQPYPAAKMFESIINWQCSADMNPDMCIDCIENFGKLVEIDHWNPLRADNRVYCKCVTNSVKQLQSLLHGSKYFLSAIIAAQGLLAFGVVFIVCIAPSKQELLTRRVNWIQVNGRSFSRRTQVHVLNRLHQERQYNSARQSVNVFALLQLLMAIAVIIFACVTAFDAGQLDHAKIPVVGVVCGLLFSLGLMLLLVSTCGCHLDIRACRICYLMCMLAIGGAFSTVAFHVPLEMTLERTLGVSNVTTLMLQDSTSIQVFKALTQRGAYDCSVEKSGGDCAETGGITCLQKSGKVFQSLVNSYCVASDECTSCLSDVETSLGQDSLDPFNRLWCKCVGAMGAIWAEKWTFLLIGALLHFAVALLVLLDAGGCCHRASTHELRVQERRLSQISAHPELQLPQIIANEPFVR